MKFFGQRCSSAILAIEVGLAILLGEQGWVIDYSYVVDYGVASYHDWIDVDCDACKRNFIC